MINLRRVIYMVLVLILAVCSTVSGESYNKKVFRISLPPGWVEMPQDIIAAYEKALAQAAPDIPRQHYDYGFQLESAPNWFEYPYILIQVKHTGRIPENDLKKIEARSIQDEMDKIKDGFGSIISELHAGKMVYDKPNRIIWMHFTANVEGTGTMMGLAGMVPTEKGIIQVNCYSMEDNYSAYESLFRSVALSTTPESDIVYKANWADHIPTAVRGIDWGKVMQRGIIGAVIGGIVGFFSFLRRNRKK